MNIMSFVYELNRLNFVDRLLSGLGLREVEEICIVNTSPGTIWIEEEEEEEENCVYCFTLTMYKQNSQICLNNNK